MQKPQKSRLEATDEELLEWARAGDMIAQTDLTKRYYDRHRMYAYRASEPLARLFDLSDLAHLFFVAFLHAYNGFEIGRGSRFSSYFVVCFRHDLIAEAASSHLFERLSVLSYDNETDEDAETSIPSVGEFLSDPAEDPARYVDYLDDVDQSLSGQIDPMAADIARLRLNGWAFTAIAEMTKQTPRQCQYLYARFLEEMKKKLTHSSTN